VSFDEEGESNLGSGVFEVGRGREFAPQTRNHGVRICAYIAPHRCNQIINLCGGRTQVRKKESKSVY
jgi:hypothetical protein